MSARDFQTILRPVWISIFGIPPTGVDLEIRRSCRVAVPKASSHLHLDRYCAESIERKRNIRKPVAGSEFHSYIIDFLDFVDYVKLYLGHNLVF